VKKLLALLVVAGFLVGTIGCTGGPTTGSSPAPKPTGSSGTPTHSAPKATEAPKTTEKPKSTEAPKTTEAPKSTEHPKTTEKPKSTEK
jgi:hypothetical protein